MVGGEEFGARGEVGAGDELCGGDFLDVGVCDPPICVGEGDTEGFDHCVEVGGAVVVGFGPGADFAGSLEFFEDAEGHESYDALTIRWMFPDLDTVVFAVGAVFAVEVISLALVHILPAEFERDRFHLLTSKAHVVL